MFTRTRIVGALLLMSLAIVGWQQSRIRALEEELEARGNPLSATEIQPVKSALKAPISNVNSDETSLKTPPQIAVAGAPAEDAALETSLEKWLGRVKRLKSWLDRKPELKTPELSLATDEDWLFATYKNNTEREEDLQKAYNWVLNGVETRITTAIVMARNDYQEANGSQALGVQQILPYLDPQLHEAVLSRYEQSKSLDSLNRRRSTGK